MELRWILAAIHRLGLAIGVGGVWSRAGAPNKPDAISTARARLFA